MFKRQDANRAVLHLVEKYLFESARSEVRPILEYFEIVWSYNGVSFKEKGTVDLVLRHNTEDVHFRGIPLMLNCIMWVMWSLNALIVTVDFAIQMESCFVN